MALTSGGASARLKSSGRQMQESSSDTCTLNCCSDCSGIKAGSAAGTHWLRNAKRYLITIRVVLGRFRSTFRMWRALSCKLSIAERKKEHHWVITTSPTCHRVQMQTVYGMLPRWNIKTDSQNITRVSLFPGFTSSLPKAAGPACDAFATKGPEHRKPHCRLLPSVGALDVISFNSSGVNCMETEARPWDIRQCYGNVFEELC